MEEAHGYAEYEATLGDRLTAARESAGLALDELAAQLGVRVETVEGWEADQAEPRAVILGRLSGMLGVPLAWFLTGEGPGPRQGEGAGHAMRAELGELRRILEEAARRVERLEGMLVDD